MFIAALFTIARTWTQPKCPSTDECIKKTWHIYTMEYYSAIKRNETDLFVVRCTEVESVIEREGSQKDKYRMLTHIYGIEENKNVMKNPRGKTGIKTQTYWRTDLRIWGGGRVSCDKARERHGHVYTTKRKVDS